MLQAILHYSTFLSYLPKLFQDSTIVSPFTPFVVIFSDSSPIYRHFFQAILSMSSAGFSSRGHTGSSNLANGTPKAPLVPTNHVTTLEGVTVRARIDPTLTVDDVVKQLCASLKKEPASNFALRDDSGELVTNDNLRKKIRGRVGLK